MKTLQLTLLATALIAGSGSGHASDINVIDATYGAGVGSFELGNFVPRGAGNLDFQSLSGGSTTMTGWTVGGVGVDWLDEPAYGASDGVHAVDLGWFDGGAGSVSIVLPTLAGATYALSFDAAAVAGFPTYRNEGTVTAGSLSAAFAPAYSGVSAFTTQVFEVQSFQFTASGTSTVLTFAAAVPGTSYGPVIDNVSVSFISAPVPEPGTWALMLAGLGLLAAGARRRGHSAV